jgi:hypothetical protein
MRSETNPSTRDVCRFLDLYSRGKNLALLARSEFIGFAI